MLRAGRLQCKTPVMRWSMRNLIRIGGHHLSRRALPMANQIVITVGIKQIVGLRSVIARSLPRGSLIFLDGENTRLDDLGRRSGDWELS
jgi:hypothetical protein